MKKRMISFLLVAALLFAGAPSAILTAQAAEDPYAAYRERDHFGFVLSANRIKYMSPDRLGEWMGSFDQIYDAFQELTGVTPLDGQRITWRSSQENGAMWIYYGEPSIYIGKDHVDYYIREAEDNDGFTGWGPPHEIGHVFDGLPGGFVREWVFNDEISANIKAVYAVDVLGLKVEHGGKLINTLEELYDYFLNYGPEHDLFLCAMINIVDEFGWDPVKKTYRSYSDGSYTGNYEGASKTSGIKYNDFLDRLSYYTGADIRAAKYFESDWLKRFDARFPLPATD